jgi:hypothetical protein
MSLRTVVAYPFQAAGREALPLNDFVAALSLDRGWFDPDDAECCLDVATSEGLLEAADDGTVRSTFDHAAVTVPADFEPETDLLHQRSVFEGCVDRIVADAGLEKQEAVAGINRLQDDLGVTVETAGVVFARRHSLDVSDLAGRALSAV